MFIPQNDNARQLGGAIDLDAFRPGPTTEEQVERLERLIRFRQRFLPQLRIDAANALFIESDGNGMAPHICRGDWMVIDTGVRRLDCEGIFAVQFPDLAPHLRRGIEIRHIRATAGGFLIFNERGRQEGREEFIPYEDVPSLRVLGRVKSVFKAV